MKDEKLLQILSRSHKYIYEQLEHRSLVDMRLGIMTNYPEEHWLLEWLVQAQKEIESKD